MLTFFAAFLTALAAIGMLSCLLARVRADSKLASFLFGGYLLLDSFKEEIIPHYNFLNIPWFITLLFFALIGLFLAFVFERPIDTSWGVATLSALGFFLICAVIGWLMERKQQTPP